MNNPLPAQGGFSAGIPDGWVPGDAEPNPREIERLAEQYVCDYSDYDEIVDCFCGDSVTANTARGAMHKLRTEIYPQLNKPLSHDEYMRLEHNMRATISDLCDCINDAAEAVA